jgi:TrmH family RNA methyltransferase
MPVLEASAELAMERLHKAGVKIWTTTAYGALRADWADLAGATALLIGNEGNGVPPDLAAKSDGAVTIPCPGPVESLNAAVAGSLLLYEASRQRGDGENKVQERNTGILRSAQDDDIKVDDGANVHDGINLDDGIKEGEMTRATLKQVRE